MGEGQGQILTGTLPYTLACTVKSRPRPTSNLTTKREEKGEKDACWLPNLGWLATYVGYVPSCALLSGPGGVISTPPQCVPLSFAADVQGLSKGERNIPDFAYDVQE